jgi:predicted nucleotidyltransferase
VSRPTKESAQRYPLTEAFGAMANVRLLRELSRHGGRLSAPDLAARVGLARASAWRALASLEKVGVVASEGSGRTRLYRLRGEHPLSVPIADLFEAEEARFASIRETVRSEADRLGALAVWIYGSTARGEDRPDSDLDIVFVAGSDEQDRAANSFREALVESAERLGFAPSVIGLRCGDIERLSGERDPWWVGVVADALVVMGPRPDELAAKLRRGKTAA